MGPPLPNTDEFNIEESRNSEQEYFRRKFEECYAKFGLEVMMEWRDGVSSNFLFMRFLSG
jgi:hypothetical protein